MFGYTCGNDVSARDQMFADGQWARAKGYDTFAPLGPWIETELDPTNLEISSTVDGEARRHGNTKDLLHPIPELIQYISDVWTLLPGDVIMTGTPSGLGGFVHGQTIDITIEGIGTLSNPARNRDSRSADAERSPPRRSVGAGTLVLIYGQALAGLGMGATFSAGALLVTQVSGSEALSGMAATGTTVGRRSRRSRSRGSPARGRAPSLATGALVARPGRGVDARRRVLYSFPLLLVGLVMLGFGTAVNLQSRFAATDLSEPGSRGRDLAFVVWATTIGAVLGPNLIGPGDAFGVRIGLPPLTGPYLFTIAAQVIAGGDLLLPPAPDPLEARRADRTRTRRDRARGRIPTGDLAGSAPA